MSLVMRRRSVRGEVVWLVALGLVTGYLTLEGYPIWSPPPRTLFTGGGSVGRCEPWQKLENRATQLLAISARRRNAKLRR